MLDASWREGGTSWTLTAPAEVRNLDIYELLKVKRAINRQPDFLSDGLVEKSIYSRAKNKEKNIFIIKLTFFKI